jgi:hypothetical protein
MRTAKAWLGAASILVTSLTAILADNVFEMSEIAVLAAVLIEAVVGVWAIYRVPNAGFVERPLPERL